MKRFLPWIILAVAAACIAASWLPPKIAKDDSATILQVVHNPTFIAPYVACVIVAAGLLVQFGFHLVGFSRQRRKAIA